MNRALHSVSRYEVPHRVPIVYDSHEVFTETPELVGRKGVQAVWKLIERHIFPRLRQVITVNESIARLYSELYHVEVKVIRNVPFRRDYKREQSRAELGLPGDKQIILLQGAGINIQRGAEEAVEAMVYLGNTILLIIGGGDIIDELKQLAAGIGLQDKVMRNELSGPCYFAIMSLLEKKVQQSALPTV